MRLRQVKYASLVVISLCALAGPGWGAQQPAAAPALATSPETATAPEVIAVTDVIPVGERTLTRLRDIRSVLDADKSVSVVEAGLPEFAQQLDEWWQVETKAVQKLQSVQRINDLTWQLRLYQNQVSAWSGLLAASSRKWSAEKETLGRLIADWQATQSALDRTAPPAVGGKIAEVLKDGEAVQRSFQQKTAQLVAVQGKLAAEMARLNEIGDAIEVARLQSAANLFTLDSPPLWTAFSGVEPAPSASTQIHDGARKLYRDAGSLYQLYSKRLLVHLSLILLLVVAFIRLRRLSNKPGEVTPTKAERYVLDRSFSSALLVGFLSVTIVYSDASPQMMRLLLIPAAIPMLLLLPAIFARRLRIAFGIITAVYVLEFWRYYLPPQWGLVRILLLVESLLGAGAFYLLHRGRLSGPASPSKESLVRAMFRIGLALFIGAILANLVGDFTLAEYLFSPFVRILYTGVLICMLAVVATTFAIMALHSQVALLSRTVQQRRSAVAEALRRLAKISAVGVFAGVALFNFGALGFVQSVLQKIFGAQLKLGAAEISIRDLVIFAVVFGIAYILSRMFRYILAQEVFPRFHMPRGVPDALELLARYGILLFGFLLALVSAGVNLRQLTIALSALGVGIGFGLQNIVNNFVCGLILVFEHPIQVGDIVEVGSHTGKVQRIGFRSSTVNTMDGGNVIIPNSELIGTKVMNWSLSDQLRRVTLHVPVPLETDPKRVMDMLLAVAHNQPDVVAYPAPSAALEKFGDSSLRFILRCWTRTEKHESVGFSVTLGINKAFQDAGIQIPFAQSDVHLHWPEKAGSEIQHEKLNQAAAGGGATPKSTGGF